MDTALADASPSVGPLPPPAYAPSVMERFGVRYLRRLESDAGARSDHAVVLDSVQRAALDRVQRSAVVRACVAGALCGVVVGVAETFTRGLVGLDAGVTDLGAVVRFWELFAAIAVPATVLEILYLYRLGLRSVHELARIAGLDLFADGRSTGKGPIERAAVAGAMARAALELPNPRRPLFGVDPMREASKTRLALGAIAYKLKIGATKAVFKVLVRRVLVRTLLRVWAPLVALPVTAAWSGVVLWAVVREARIRALGASAAREMMDAVFEDAPELSRRARLAVIRAIAACIVRSRDLHPNLVCLLHEAFARVGPVDDTAELLDEPRLFLEDLRALAPEEQRLALRVLGVAAILDGRFTGSESELLRQAQAAAGRSPDLAPTNHLRRAFVSGHAIACDDVRAIA